MSLNYDEYSKRIENAIIRYMSGLNPEVGLALTYYFNELEKHISRFSIGDYRVKVKSEFPHVLIPLPLLGAYWFIIKKLYFNIRLSNPFRRYIKILFSRKYPLAK